MKLVHLAAVRPHQNGLYETTRDLVAAERALGVDARIVDPYALSEDRGVPVGCGGVVLAADLIVNHSGLGVHQNIDTPIVHVLHGRPESSFRLEQSGEVPVLSIVSKMGRDPRIKVFVTFWADHVPYWEWFLPGREIVVLNAPVDLSQWSDRGWRGYEFGGKRGLINVVCTDPWRCDKTPFHVIFGFMEFADRHPGAKLHLYGLPEDRRGIDVLLGRLRERGTLGEVQGTVTNLPDVYRAADMLITPHRIATRAVREALACGCPLVAGYRMPHGLVNVDTEAPVGFGAAMENVLATAECQRTAARVAAVKEFDSKRTAEQFVALCEKVREVEADGDVKLQPVSATEYDPDNQ